MALPSCGPKEAAPVKKDMCVQMYSARSIINHDNYGELLKTIAGMGYTVLFKVPYGQPVTVLKHNDNWDKISYGGKTGFIENKYLNLVQPKNAPTPTPEPTQKPKFKPYYATITSPNGKDVNVHYKPDKNTSNVHGMGNNGRLPVGTTVYVLGLTGNWAEIEYDGKTGFVMQQYLTK